MKLDAWMEQGHSLDENLELIESLCQTVNEVHDRGEAIGGLQPSRIEIEPGGRCDLSEARGSAPSPDYAPPDGEGDSAADVFAVGRIAWEILAGRSAGESPQHLSELRSDIAKELADAIMACLESSADWRPKDLTFLAQMAAARQKGAARSPSRGRGSTRTPRTPARRRSRQQGGRTWPLLAALVVVLGLAFFAWRQFGPAGRPGTGASSAQPTPSPAAPPTVAPPVGEAAPPDEVAPSPVDTPTPVATEPTPNLDYLTPAVDTEPQAPSQPEPVRRPETEPVAPPPPAPRSAPAVVPSPVRNAPPEPPVTSRPAPPAQSTAPPAPVAPPRTPPATSRPATQAPAPAPITRPEAAAPAAPAPAPAPPAAPAVLTAVSPLEVKRPGKVLVDLRGEGFQDQHQVRVLPVKKAPRGITVVRHKRANDTLITVLIELSDDVEPGEYAFALEDAQGTRTEPLIFRVTK